MQIHVRKDAQVFIKAAVLSTAVNAPSDAQTCRPLLGARAALSNLCFWQSQ